MKKFMMIAVMMVATLAANAQQPVGTWSIMPKAGFNLANLAGDVEGNSIKFGLVIGGDAMYQVNQLLAVSGGMYYSTQGCEGEGDTSISINELNIPLLANFYVAQNLALKIGLQPAFILSAEGKSGKTTVEIEAQTVELSIPFGISYEIGQFMIDGRYNLGISKVNKNSGSVRNSVFQFTLGYKFNL